MRLNFYPPRKLVLASLAATSVACTPIPIYQPPSDRVDRAHIKIDFQDESLLFGVAILYKVEKPILCGKPMKVERMVVISKGNPLISDQNPAGVYVPTGRRMTLSSMGLNDKNPACGRAFSFIPEAGKSYSLRVANNSDRYSGSKPCGEVDLLQYQSSVRTDGASVEVPSFQFEACVQN